MSEVRLKISPELKKEWVAALRSGKYAQTRGRLKIKSGELGREETGYCCLGVLREISLDLQGAVAEVGGFLWADKGGDPVGVCQKEQSELAHMNDKGIKFAAIADYIEHSTEI